MSAELPGNNWHEIHGRVSARRQDMKGGRARHRTGGRRDRGRGLVTKKVKGRPAPEKATSDPCRGLFQPLRVKTTVDWSENSQRASGRLPSASSYMADRCPARTYSLKGFSTAITISPSPPSRMAGLPCP